MYNVILDCDPGHDDAIALLLASRADNIRLLGVTTVAGNSYLENVTRNARRVLDYAGVTDVDVYAGAAKPLCTICTASPGRSSTARTAWAARFFPRP